MASESRTDRRPVDWARFGLSSEQNSASSEVQFANKPSVLDETSYGGQEIRDNELYTEEQVRLFMLILSVRSQTKLTFRLNCNFLTG